jgi:DNA-binding SARP family transcriptional activator/predicted ATPase
MLKISVIGKANVVIGDSEPLTFRTHKAEAILYYLIIVSQPVTRAALAELFWPEMSSANAQKNLRAVLPDLRNLLGANLIITPYDLAFNQNSNHTVDLYQLYAILDDASLSDELMLAELLKRYHGELFAGFSVTHSPQFEEWVRNQREATQQKVVQRLQELTERFLYNKAFKAGLDATQMWLTLEPWNELVHRLRMQIFWLSGQRSAALVQYNHCVEYLAEELAVTPSPETKKLYIQIQQNDRSLFEQDARQRSISNRPRHNLPKRFTSFVGREKEIATLLQHLQSGKYPLITISGEGGSGKTRLSIALAERILTEPTRQRYGDGIWFINCANIAADVTTQEHLLIHIGSLLGIEFQSRTSFFQQLVAYLAPRSMLLILDSFEHLSDHGLVLIDLLQQTPNLQILVTSRHDLRLQRTLSMRLEGLDVPLLAKKPLDYALSDSELSQLLQVASVKVFYDRAHIIWPPFTVDKDNAVIIARLCQLLEGNPLALELAATQLNEYDLETLLRELSSSYLLLASDLQDLPPRQRSIYNTLNYSWQLLSPALAELLARCSVFRANFSYQAATAITGASARLITQLINRSLLSNDEQRRVQIHEMVRQFAASKLAQNPTLEAATQKRYAEYFLGLLLQWWEGNESRHWVVQLLPDMNNIYAAWDWAFSHQQFELLSRSMIAFIQFHIYTGQLWDMHLHVNAYYQKLLKQSAQEINTSNAQNYQEMQCALTYGRGLPTIDSVTMSEGLNCSMKPGSSSLSMAIGIWQLRLNAI